MNGCQSASVRNFRIFSRASNRGAVGLPYRVAGRQAGGGHHGPPAAGSRQGAGAPRAPGRLGARAGSRISSSTSWVAQRRPEPKPRRHFPFSLDDSASPLRSTKAGAQAPATPGTRRAAAESASGSSTGSPAGSAATRCGSARRASSPPMARPWSSSSRRADGARPPRLRSTSGASQPPAARSLAGATGWGSRRKGSPRQRAGHVESWRHGHKPERTPRRTCPRLGPRSRSSLPCNGIGRGLIR